MNTVSVPRRYSFLHRHAYKILSVVLVLGFLNAWWPYTKIQEQIEVYLEHRRTQAIHQDRAGAERREVLRKIAEAERLKTFVHPALERMAGKLNEFGDAIGTRVPAKLGAVTRDYDVPGYSGIERSWFTKEVQQDRTRIAYSLYLDGRDIDAGISEITFQRGARYAPGRRREVDFSWWYKLQVHNKSNPESIDLWFAGPEQIRFLLSISRGTTQLHVLQDSGSLFEQLGNSTPYIIEVPNLEDEKLIENLFSQPDTRLAKISKILERMQLVRETRIAAGRFLDSDNNFRNPQVEKFYYDDLSGTLSSAGSPFSTIDLPAIHKESLDSLKLVLEKWPIYAPNCFRELDDFWNLIKPEREELLQRTPNSVE
jgi:hypothetical protein